MQKAAEDLKRQQEEAAAEKKAYIEKLVPKLSIDGLSDGIYNKWNAVTYRLFSILLEFVLDTRYACIP